MRERVRKGGVPGTLQLQSGLKYVCEWEEDRTSSAGGGGMLEFPDGAKHVGASVWPCAPGSRPEATILRSRRGQAQEEG
eukprot:gene10341-12228_t